MTISSPHKIKVKPEIIDRQNERLIKYLNKILDENSETFKSLRKKVGITYWITIILYVVVFILGILLLSVPVYYAYLGDIATYTSIISGTLGITDLVVLFLFRPVERIHDIMGDISQLTIINTSYQEQIAIILLEMDVTDKNSLQLAVKNIDLVTQSSMSLIELYFEGKSN